MPGLDLRQSLSARGTGAEMINLWLIRAARACEQRQLLESQAYDLLAANITRKDKYRCEIERAINKAYSTNPTFDAKPIANLKQYNPRLLAKHADRVPFEIDKGMLAE